MNMFGFLEATPVEINQGIATRVRAVRKRRKISQIKLSEKSGLGFFVNSAIVIFLCLSYNISSKGDVSMLNEVVFFETRIFRMFCEKLKVSPVDANKLFEKYGIWKYIEDTYDMLHLSSDEYALKNILEILKVNGVNYEV